ncbi:hypothetical protein ACH5RR_015399 [Cinchona calisaya]|uniref:Uncharacterized protein n=1 Tax=Cinchona calisaya TaxID=153742 RepID=A0ABD2ZW70_9GENT
MEKSKNYHLMGVEDSRFKGKINGFSWLPESKTLLEERGGMEVMNRVRTCVNPLTASHGSGCIKSKVVSAVWKPKAMGDVCSVVDVIEQGSPKGKGKIEEEMQVVTGKDIDSPDINLKCPIQGPEIGEKENDWNPPQITLHQQEMLLNSNSYNPLATEDVK